jgi:hypothetical protein
MTLPKALAIIVLASVVAADASASAEQFRHLSGAEIETRFSGRMLTDDRHWRETYRPDGKLFAEQMGGAPISGLWRAGQDRLCTVLPGIRDTCYAVWLAADRVELRHADYPTVEAFLRSSRSAPIR